MTMTVHYYKPWAIGIIGLALWLAGISDVAATTLKDSMQLALRYSPGLAAQRSNFFALRQTRYISFSAMLPSAVASAERSKTHLDYFLPGGSTIPSNTLYSDGWKIELRQRLFSSGKNFNEYRRTRADILRAYHELRAAEQTIVLAVITAHVDILRAQAVVDINRKNVDVLQRQYNAAKDRFDLGQGNRTAVAQSESRLALAQRNLRTAEVGLEVALASYAELTGQIPQNLEPPVSLPRLPESRDEALRIAQFENPNLLAAKETTRRARYRTLSAVGDVLPQVDFLASYGRRKNPSAVRNLGNNVREERTSFQLSASIPLFAGGRNAAGISAARSAAIAQTRTLEARLAQVVREIAVAWYNHDASPAQIRSARQQIVSASIALDGVRQQYDVGARTILDVLDAEQELLNARVGLVGSERDQIVAAYSLLASVGRLTQEYLQLAAPLE